MKKLSVNLEHCYGIKKLKEDFDFSKFRTILIYAANGVMKTSFAKTFKVLSVGKDTPSDQMNNTLTSTYDLLVDDTGNQISKENICVIEPYNEKVLASEDKILSLLIDKKGKEEYWAVYQELETSKKGTLSSLRTLTGSNNYEAEISESFAHLGKRNIYEILEAVLPSIKSSKDKFNFIYNDVFDPEGKVEDFVRQNHKLLTQYIEKFEELVSHSDFFGINHTNTFGTTEAKDLNESLKDDSYFAVGHKLILKGLVRPVETQEEFSNRLDAEVERIFNDKDLKDIREKIEKKLNTHKNLRTFKKVIESKKHRHILSKLDDYHRFRQEVWFSFLKEIEPGIESLVSLYNSKKPDLEKLIRQAELSKSSWESTILEFENRFIDMPFSIQITNKVDVILNEKAPVLELKFEKQPIQRKELVDNVLSQGERRAFYLLNVIFEIKSRQLENKETLFIIDDIADSFDYKNKYAIVEYLNDLSKDENFYSIILTHNFDFFRTLRSRILPSGVQDTNSFIAEKTKDAVTLVTAQKKNVIDPFKVWKKNVNTDKKYLIACIPFVRNLIEFKRDDNKSYKLLTHTLHFKDEDKTIGIKATTDIDIKDLEPVFSDVLSGIKFNFPDHGNEKVIDVLDELARDIDASATSSSVVLEDKIVLAIAIRLKAEEYMLSQVSDKSPIEISQTGVLFGRYKKEFAGDPRHDEILRTLESVVILTPENIHLNSFMYEPILDMGIEELKNLYKKFPLSQTF